MIPIDPLAYDTAAGNAMLGELLEASDRAAVLCAAAYIDERLAELLQAFLPPKRRPAKDDELLEGDAPLSTFSARAKMVARLGLLPLHVVQAIDILRDVRNTFAHDVVGCDLEAGPLWNQVRSALDLLCQNPGGDPFLRGDPRGFLRASAAQASAESGRVGRGNFVALAHYLGARVHHALSNVVSLDRLRAGPGPAGLAPAAPRDPDI
ncbi:MAG TPA: hypothetical protein VF796_18520 [Humisphaera sp.]